MYHCFNVEFYCHQTHFIRFIWFSLVISVQFVYCFFGIIDPKDGCTSESLKLCSFLSVFSWYCLPFLSLPLLFARYTKWWCFWVSIFNQRLWICQSTTKDFGKIWCIKRNTLLIFSHVFGNIRPLFQSNRLVNSHWLTFTLDRWIGFF